jgi:hypothetical protein
MTHSLRIWDSSLSVDWLLFLSPKQALPCLCKDTTFRLLIPPMLRRPPISFTLSMSKLFLSPVLILRPWATLSATMSALTQVTIFLPFICSITDKSLIQRHHPELRSYQRSRCFCCCCQTPSRVQRRRRRIHRSLQCYYSRILRQDC